MQSEFIDGPKVEIRATQQRDVGMLDTRLRVSDVNELRLLRGRTALEEIQASVENAKSCWTVELDKEVSAIFGVGRLPVEDHGLVWLLATDRMYQIAWRFARESRTWIHRLMEGHKRLENIVSVKNEVAIRWLRWLGFKFTGVRSNVGPQRAEFWKFSMSRSDLSDDTRRNSSAKGSLALDKMLFPQDVDHFLHHNLEGDRPCLIRGYAGKFDDIFSWRELENCLSHSGIAEPRIRCYRDGRSLPGTYFLRGVRGHGRRGQKFAEIDPARLRTAAEQGATIILDQVDKLAPRLGRFVSDLECRFEEFVNVNAYASWGKTFGFDTHWDLHDVFVVQIAGRKKWRLYGTTRENPLKMDLESAPKPENAPNWERILEAGDLLFLPRGVWHGAQNVNTGSLHLTFGLKRRTGIDYLEWLIQKATAQTIFRTDLPFLSSTTLQEERNRQLASKFIGILNEYGMDSYRVYLATQASERSTVYLDTSLSLMNALKENGARLALSSKRATMCKVSKESFKISANGKCWNLANQVYPLFEFLGKNQTMKWRDVRDLIDEANIIQTVETLEALWKDGLLVVQRN